MMHRPMAPVARYAFNGECSIAWTELGQGRFDLVFVTGLISHVEAFWDDPGLDAFFRRLAQFARVIVVDRRGTGLSDRISGDVSIDDEVADVEAVLDAAGVDRAVLMGYTTGGALAIRFAARRPERVLALVLYAAIVNSVNDGDYDFTHDAAEREALTERRIRDWGTGALLDVLAPSLAGDRAKREWLARMERLSSSPGAVRALLGLRVDVREDLGELRVPALVLHRRDDRLISVQHGRWLAEHLPGARYVELDGEDNLPSAGDMDALLGEVEEFLTGSRGLTRERALLTVLFTDVVGSTQHAARLGDERWSSLLSAQDAAVRRVVERHGGRPVKSIGDAVLAVFEGAPSKALRAALAARDASTDLGLELRCGLHTGECEVLGDDVGGMAVHIAARIASLAGPGEVLASGTAYGTVVGSGLHFEDRGMQELRGVHGRWPVFALTG
jgi:class 3 adenylate cyclase/alpha-beta hydrolase superfamily lysophospholipase